VTRELLEAIRAVRRVGDVGAQMAMGVDTIVPATPEEARALLLLVQMLFTEWYQARSDREAHLANVLEVATGKHAAR
jgi:pantoate kinase